MRSHRTVFLLLATLAAVIVLGSCAPGPNPLAEQAVAGKSLAGFWLGLWHGLIVWVTFIVSLFDSSVAVYEVHNAGWSYNLGFVIGAACLHGGGGAGACRGRRNRA